MGRAQRGWTTTAALAACCALAVWCGVAAPASAASLAAPRDQVLRANIGTMPGSLDPGRAANVEDLVVANAIFTPLYRSAGGSDGRLVPWLAIGQPRVSNGGRRYVVRLRSARWSDGRPVLASDVAFAYKRARSLSPYGAAFTQVRSVDAIGQRTVRFELRRPVPWFGELLSSTVTTPVPAHVVRRYGNRWTRLDKLVTSGPFRVLSGRGRSELVLVPNKRWWGARTVRLQQLKLWAITPAASSPLFSGKRLDVGLRDTSVHPSLLAKWINDRRFHVVPSGNAQYLFLNTQAPGLAAANVRRAIALAIDRHAITELTGTGIDQPLQSIVPAGVRGFSAVVGGGTTLLQQDGAARLAGAQSELAGGWPAGQKLDLYYPYDGSAAGKVAASIRTDLAKLGIVVTLHPTATKDFAKVGIGVAPVRSEVDAVLQGWTPDYSDPQSFQQLFTCANVEQGLNLSNYCSSDYDSAYDSATTTSGAARIAALQQAEQLLTSPGGAMPAVPLYEPAGDYLVQPWVSGFVQDPKGTVNFERVRILDH
ncbi:MAG: peptide ABC transporter substrate-binding protein [Thermoleophilia bacterium]|nr:peptide ABC transporter substrate-binding protein [Thermoleophilia bacterium]